VERRDRFVDHDAAHVRLERHEIDEIDSACRCGGTTSDLDLAVVLGDAELATERRGEQASADGQDAVRVRGVGRPEADRPHERTEDGAIEADLVGAREANGDLPARGGRDDLLPGAQIDDLEVAYGAGDANDGVVMTGHLGDDAARRVERRRAQPDAQHGDDIGRCPGQMRTEFGAAAARVRRAQLGEDVFAAEGLWLLVHRRLRRGGRDQRSEEHTGERK
jgi:hypothetical protein